MKIIKEGTPPESRVWQGRCRNCNAEAEALQSELTGITYDQREHGSLSWEKCPLCRKGPYGGMLFYSPR